MTGIQAPAGGHRWTVAVGVVAALAYASSASLTHPFSDGADIVTALPIAVALAVMAVRMRSWWRPAPVVGSGEPVPTPDRLWSAWAATAALVAGWEVYCYTAAPRSQHPTLSSLLDGLDSSHAGKALAFALWLALGWYLVRR
ncbi:MAG: hypothetical protein ABSF33_10845 [Acidimicrobiales bacterium]